MFRGAPGVKVIAEKKKKDSQSQVWYYVNTGA